MAVDMLYIYNIKSEIYNIKGAQNMKKVNYLGFLSLLALIAVLGYTTGNQGLYGFLGFAYYIRYFFVIPDEMFMLHVRKACTAAYLIQMVSLVPFLFLTYSGVIGGNPMPAAFGLSFAASIFIFTFQLIYMEYKESRCR